MGCLAGTTCATSLNQKRAGLADLERQMVVKRQSVKKKAQKLEFMSKMKERGQMLQSDVADCRTHFSMRGSIPDLRGYTVTFNDLFDPQRWCGTPNETRESRARCARTSGRYFGDCEYGALNGAAGVITGGEMLAYMVQVQFTDHNGTRWNPTPVPVKYLWDLQRVESTHKKHHAALAKAHADLAKPKAPSRRTEHHDATVSDMDLDY